MTLWFENSLGHMRKIADCKDWKEVNQEINAFVDRANTAKAPGQPPFKRYYTRTWEDESTGMTKIDIGSWSEFFYLGE